MHIAIETFSAVGLEASDFFSDLGRRLHYVTHEPRAYTFLMQCISVAVQRGNARGMRYWFSAAKC